MFSFGEVVVVSSNVLLELKSLKKLRGVLSWLVLY